MEISMKFLTPKSSALCLLSVIHIIDLKIISNTFYSCISLGLLVFSTTTIISVVNSLFLTKNFLNKNLEISEEIFNTKVFSIMQYQFQIPKLFQTHFIHVFLLTGLQKAYSFWTINRLQSMIQTDYSLKYIIDYKEPIVQNTNRL